MDSIYFLILAMLLPLLLRYVLDRYRCRNLPRGPSGLPVLGNLLQLGDLPHYSLKKFAEKYGDIMCVKLGSYPTIIVSSCDKAKLFFKNHDADFATRFNTVAGEVLLGKNDIIMAPYGDQWKHLRKICVAHLLNQRLVETAREIMEAEASMVVESLWEQSCHGQRAVDLTRACMEMVFNINLRFFTGKRELIMWDGEPVDFKGFLDEGSRLLGEFNVGDFLPFLRWFDLQGICRKARHLRCKVDDAFCKMLEEYSQKPRESEQQEKKHFIDVISHIIQIERIVDADSGESLMRDMLAAGTETTATALEWAISHLVKNPEIMRKLRQDMKSVVAEQGKARPDGLSVENMKYLHCVIKETLRMHPSATLGLPHQSIRAVDVDGFHIPKDTRVLFNLWAMGRDERVWEEADQFRPERFMMEQVVDVCGNSDFRMLPFGAGRRGCPGTVLVAPMLKICIAALVFGFDWTPEHGESEKLDMTEAYALSTGRKNRLMLIPRLANP